MRASLEEKLHLLILKLLFPSIYCWYTSDTLSQKHIYFQVSNYICIHYTINHQCSFLSLLMVWHYINDSMPTKH